MNATDWIHFPDVSLLITHYNRSSSLERELEAFESLRIRFGDIVVSDDGSKSEHLSNINAMQSRFSFRLIKSEKNRGLGHNINKGQHAVHTLFTLYVQEDFVPQPAFRQALQDALHLLRKHPEIDIARFYAYEKFPYLKHLQDGFSVMNFRFFSRGYQKYYYYSDHPHLRRDNFLEKFGPYSEGLKGDQTEYNMMLSFVSRGGRGIFYDRYKSLFDQVNTEAEPSTMRRNYFRNSQHVGIVVLRHLYRHVKFNFDYLKRKFFSTG